MVFRSMWSAMLVWQRMTTPALLFTEVGVVKQVMGRFGAERKTALKVAALRGPVSVKMRMER